MENKSIFSTCLKYEHFKCGIYKLDGFATHTESDESLVIYSDENSRMWARPLAEFVGLVEVEKGYFVPRFELLPTTRKQTELT